MTCWEQPLNKWTELKYVQRGILSQRKHHFCVAWNIIKAFPSVHHYKTNLRKESPEACWTYSLTSIKLFFDKSYDITETKSKMRHYSVAVKHHCSICILNSVKLKSSKGMWVHLSSFCLCVPEYGINADCSEDSSGFDKKHAPCICCKKNSLNRVKRCFGTV